MTTSTTHHAPRRRKRPTPRPASDENVAPSESDASVSHAAAFMEPERRNAMISDAAYFLAEQRDFASGHELDDWLTAERDIEHLISSGQSEFERET